MSNDAKVALCLLLTLVGTSVAITISIGNANESRRMHAICYAELRTATASDSLRIYRLQPKCLP